ncbi:hypothetical protein JCM33374_g3542 [Metschnikowia sp. JCM 33374]|nr:hypothetical protein JCM33374_g3542 [Metschnikowia sp. JCM 33374]
MKVLPYSTPLNGHPNTYIDIFQRIHTHYKAVMNKIVINLLNHHRILVHYQAPLVVANCSSHLHPFKKYNCFIPPRDSPNTNKPSEPSKPSDPSDPSPERFTVNTSSRNEAIPLP